MHHVAIMKKSLNLIPKILSGEKTIESRWYRTKRAPWGNIKTGDLVFFKNSGGPIVAKAKVFGVSQIKLQNISDVRRIIKAYGKKICINDVGFGASAKYCILIYLRNPKSIKKSFLINKKGFGIGAAWITLKNIKKIKIPN